MHLEFGSHRFDISHRAVVVGSVNRAPDRSVGGHPLGAIDSLLTRAERLVSQGADALDIGAVSHHAGDGVTEAEERAWMVPAVAALHSRFELPLWFGTRRATVAASCFDAGAIVVEDGSGFADPDVLSAGAVAGASVVIAHVPAVGRPRVEQPMGLSTSASHARPNGAVAATCDRLVSLAADAAAAGIPSQRVMVDPGSTLGYGDHRNNDVLRAVQELTDRGHRVVMSVSSDPLEREAPDVGVNDSDNVAVAIQTLGIARGCRILRTDDIRIARRVSEVLGAVLEHR
jgi:dihydropteroate synthase